MTEPSLLALTALLLWGTLVGLDLVSVAQSMIARPFVAGTVAGAILGDMGAGMRVGVLFELFALDVLPVGAARYPDYGPATVAATAAAAGSPWELSLGLAGTVGLLIAVLGGWSLQALRQLNARDIQRWAAALAAYVAARYAHLDRGTAVALTLTLVGAGLAAALSGALRGAGRGPRLRWLAVGIVVGIALAVLV